MEFQNLDLTLYQRQNVKTCIFRVPRLNSLNRIIKEDHEKS